MRTKTLKQLLSMTVLTLLAAAAGAVVLGFYLPINVPNIKEQPESTPTTEVSHKEHHRIPELASLQLLASKDLRQRLFDPPPEPTPVTPPKPPPSIRLLGTIVNATNPQAMVSGPGGNTELLKVGDRVGDPGNTAIITEILTDHIKVEHDGSTLNIKVEEDGGQLR